MSSKSTVLGDQTLVPAIYAREGDGVGYVIPVSGVVTGISSPTMAFYKEGQTTDLSATYWTGSMSVTGVNKIITKTTQNLKVGNYVLSINATVDGQSMNVVTIPFKVKRRSEL